jgi:choline dehydrogenase-like flavoprotein
MSDGRMVDIRAKTVVVAAGALASSVILRRSGIGGDRVGRDLAFNLACPIVADFPTELRSNEGLQMSHYLAVPGDRVALETWYQPLLGMALFMPGWFADHQHNMRRYSHLTAVGVVVGSQNGGRVKPSRLSRRAVDLEYEPSKRDLKLMLEGIRLASRVMLEGGATRVMPPTFEYAEASDAEGIDAMLSRIADDSDLSINSAHPQGGNPISRDHDKGVVDERLRVHGFENVYVCDASVFPTSVTVNPQLTVMALADYAVRDLA